MAKKLSHIALIMLSIVDQETLFDGEGKMIKYFVPSTRTQYVTMPNGKRIEHIVSGSDGNSLRGLERNGMIKRERASEYSYSITESGRIAIEAARAKAVR